MSCIYTRYKPFIRYLLSGGTVVKNPPANAGDTSLIPGPEDREEMATHFCLLDWKTPWIKEPGGLQFIGSQRVRHKWALTRQIYVICKYFLPFSEIPLLDNVLCSIKVFNFEKIHLSLFSFVVCSFDTTFEKVLPNWRSGGFTIYSILRVYTFSMHI